jgi:tetratricopeptide (TPR) repeat protein
VRNELARYSLHVDVVVPRLSVEDIEALLRERYSRYDGTERFRRWLAERSGGNALFVTQYLKTLEEDGVVCADTGEFRGRYEDVRVPKTAFAVVEERIRRLDPEESELLRYASVEGATFTASVLSRLAGVPRLRLLQRLRLVADRHGVVKSLGKQRIYASESTAYQFTNAVLQRALLESLEEEEREELHAMVFRCIKEDWEAASDADSAIVGVAARLVAHAREPGERLYAAQLLRQAARVSWHRFAEEETQSVLQTLRATLDSLGAVQRVTGELDLGALADVSLLDAEARMIAGLIDKFRARYAAALGHFHAARVLFDHAGAERRAVKAMMREAFVLENASRYDEALVASRATLERAQRIGYAKVEAAMWNNLGLVEIAQGRAAEALEHQRKSLAVRETIGDRVGQAVALGGIGHALFAAGRVEEALEQHRRSLAIHQEIDDRIGAGHALAAIGGALAVLGRREEALEHHRRGAEVCESSGDIVGEIAAQDNVARLSWALGRPAEAVAPHERAAALAEQLGDHAMELAHRERLGTLLRTHGEASRSRLALERARALAEHVTDASAAERIAAELSLVPPPSLEDEPPPPHSTRAAAARPPHVRDPEPIPWEARVVMWVEDRVTRPLRR